MFGTTVKERSVGIGVRKVRILLDVGRSMERHIDAIRDALIAYEAKMKESIVGKLELEVRALYKGRTLYHQYFDKSRTLGSFLRSLRYFEGDDDPEAFVGGCEAMANRIASTKYNIHMLVISSPAVMLGKRCSGWGEPLEGVRNLHVEALAVSETFGNRTVETKGLPRGVMMVDPDMLDMVIPRFVNIHMGMFFHVTVRVAGAPSGYFEQKRFQRIRGDVEMDLGNLPTGYEQTVQFFVEGEKDVRVFEKMHFVFEWTTVHVTEAVFHTKKTSLPLRIYPGEVKPSVVPKHLRRCCGAHPSSKQLVRCISLLEAMIMDDEEENERP